MAWSTSQPPHFHCLLFPPLAWDSSVPTPLRERDALLTLSVQTTWYVTAHIKMLQDKKEKEQSATPGDGCPTWGTWITCLWEEQLLAEMLIWSEMKGECLSVPSSLLLLRLHRVSSTRPMTSQSIQTSVQPYQPCRNYKVPSHMEPLLEAISDN